MTSTNGVHAEKSPEIQAPTLIGVHLDLKGVQFRPDYLPQLLKDLRGQGVNTLLVEYEDIFPFRGVDIAADPGVVWTRDVLENFLSNAQRLELQVIPLQQCLAHLEYLFRWDELRPYALDTAYPSTLDIDNPDAVTLVEQMLRQVIEAHPHSTYVHLGMDEAWALHRGGQTDEQVYRAFVEYLERLCDLCEGYGKTPVIWSDMLENHMTKASMPYLERLKSRVVVCTWDYVTTEARTPVARLGGHHIRREWLETPHDLGAPVVASETKFVEEMPAELRALVETYGEGKHFTAFFQCDLWTRLGFRMLGTTSCRVSSDGAVMPYYNQRHANISLWADTVRRTGQLGMLASAWARGTSWCPPNFAFDLCWPLIHALGMEMGAHPNAFFAGLEPSDVERIFRTLGRCREDWRREAEVVREMQALAPRLLSHGYEWQSAILMARLHALHRRVDFAVQEVEDFWANARPVDSEWQRRLDEQGELLDDLASLRGEVVAHFLARYWGRAFEEWVGVLFDIHKERLRRCGPVCRRKMAEAHQEYRAVPGNGSRWSGPHPASGPAEFAPTASSDNWQVKPS